MREFQFVVRDDRYSVSTQLRVTANDEGAARRMAEAALQDSSRHLMVEVWEHDVRVFSIGSRTPLSDVEANGRSHEVVRGRW
jgi:hypothetical protein